jgi:pectate lyase
MLRKMKVFALAALILLQSAAGIGSIPAQAATGDELFGLTGFASISGGTTGGTGGKEITVSSMSDMSDLLNQRKKNNDTSPLIIKIGGKITGAGAVGVKEVKNISIIGVGSSAELEGVGLNIVKSSNIIIQNLRIHHTLAPTDCIGIESSDHIWVDHCELYNMIGDCNGDGVVDTKGDIPGGDVDWYDGLLDCKKNSEYITVSWNYFHDAFKTSLVGSSDSDTYDRKMTFHHNVFKNCKERLPSYRGGTGHIFDNYYVDVWNSAVNSRMGAKLRVENNCFENVGSGNVNDESGLAAGPIGSYNSTAIGYYDVKDNTYLNCRGNQPVASTCSFVPSYDYSKYLTPVSEVKAMVTRYAGVGRLDGSNSSTIGENTGGSGDVTVKIGDINGDGSINTLDYAAFKQYLLGISTSIKTGAADLNSDKAINIIDFAILKKYLLGQITTLPVTESTGGNTGGTSEPAEGDITVEPNGTMTLQQAIESIKPGKTIYMKSGTYSMNKTVTIAEGNNGTSSDIKNISVLGDGQAILDFSALSFSPSNRGIILAGNYWNIKGIKIQKAGDNGMLLAGNNNVIDTCEFYANRDSGLQISRFNTNYTTIDKWPGNNTIKNCYSHSNYDPDNGEDADGFAAKLTCGNGNKFISCVSKYNVDDGWDLFTKEETGKIGSIYFEDCEASYNGKTESGQYTANSDGNGFKLGGSKISVDHTLVRCRAYNNKKHGFTWNSNPGKLTLTGCDASGNGGNNFEKVTNN